MCRRSRGGDAVLAGGSAPSGRAAHSRADRYDVMGPNWALLRRALALPLLRLLTGCAGRRGRCPAHPASETGRTPGTQADAIRLARRRFDVAHYYHYSTTARRTSTLRQRRGRRSERIDWTIASPDQVEAIVSGLRGAAGATWQRRQHIGFDVGTTAGPFVLRVDAAYQQPALFYDRALNGWLSPAIETVVGLEYQTGSLGRTISLEGRHRHIRKALPDGGILYFERDSVDMGVLARWTWAAVEVETRGAIGVRPRSLVLRPQISWKAGGLGISSGLVILEGSHLSYGDWYRPNGSVYLMIRKGF